MYQRICFLTLFVLMLFGIAISQSDVPFSGCDDPPDSTECVFETVAYPAFEFGVDRDGFQVVIGISHECEPASRFSSAPFKRRVLLAGRNVPATSHDFTHYLFTCDRSEVVLLSEHHFPPVPEVHFLKYSVANWNESDGAFDNTEIIVAYNDSLDQIYLLTHPDPLKREPTRSGVARGSYPLVVMQGNFNSMLTDSRTLREMNPLCVAGLFAGLQTWICGYPSVLVSSADHVMNAIRLSQARSQQSSTVDRYAADELVVYFPIREAQDPADHAVAKPTALEQAWLQTMLRDSGVPLAPEVLRTGPASVAISVEISFVGTVNHRLHRVRIDFDIAGLIRAWQFVAPSLQLTDPN